jgi:uncharacterized SAM-binding protein YcdF (DUF218 family)
MFFILSKVFYFLIMPLTVTVLLLVLSVVIRNVKWKRRLFWSSFGMLLFFSNDFIANEVMLAWEIPVRPFKEMRKFKLGIVLTGVTLPDTGPNDRIYFNKGADRVTHTVQLYKLGLIEKILISGGSGKIFGEAEPEANKLKRAMLLMCVPEEDILIENETRNTAESAIEVKKILDTRGYSARDCLLITSAFHMRRSLAVYEKAGLALETFSTDFYTHQRTFEPEVLLIPQLQAITIWHKLVKEWVGMAAYKIAGYI